MTYDVNTSPQSGFTRYDIFWLESLEGPLYIVQGHLYVPELLPPSWWRNPAMCAWNVNNANTQSDHYSNQRNYDHQQIQYRQCHDRGHVQVWWLPRENLKRIANHKLKMFYFQWVTEILCQEGIPWLQDIIIVVLMIFFSWCVIFYIIFLKEIGWNFELRPFWYWNLELSHFWQLRARKEN